MLKSIGIALLIGIFMINALFGSGKMEMKRYGMFIGANYGGKNKDVLKYAVKDAQALSKLMVEMGGVDFADNYLLIQPTTSDLFNKIISMQLKIHGQKNLVSRTELVFYYSGHSDEDGICLGDEKIDYKTLKDTLEKIPVDMRLVILDSCSSGAITRLKGGAKQQPFLMDKSVQSKGYAFLTSSSLDEVSQESDNLKGSFFTHSLMLGLRGAADMSGDSKVTLNEAYQYAYDETLKKTEKTLGGAQHPNYDIRMSGSGDVVLTDLREISASLIVGAEISGTLYIRENTGTLVAEISKSEGRTVELGLESGIYQITLEKDKKYFQQTVTIAEGKRLELTRTMLNPVQTVATVSRGGKKIKNEDKKDMVISPFEINIFPFDFTGADSNRINNMSLSLINGECYELNGIALAGVMHTASYKVNGFQISTFLNTSGGDVNGGQISSIMNIASGNVFGGQYGLVNIVGGDLNLLQIGTFNMVGMTLNGMQFGVVNIVGEGVNGFQGSVVNIAGGELNGVQTSVVNICGDRMNGAQMGVFNLMGNHANGAQMGVVNVGGGDINGLQAGVVNVSGGKVSTMIGVLNIAEKSDLPLGLVNVIWKGRYNPTLWHDEMGYNHLGIKHGGKFFHNIYAVGADETFSNISASFGIGGRIPIGNFYIEADTIASYLFPRYEVNLENFEMVLRARVGVGLKLIGDLAVYGGFSYNIYGYNQDSTIRLPNTIAGELSTQNFHFKYWTGFYGGIEL